MDSDDVKIISVIAVAIAVIGACLFGIFYRREEQVQAVGISWERSINIEQFKTVRHDDWSMPATAILIKRHSEIHHWDRYISGYEEVCEGTGKKRSCHSEAKYSSRPVYADKYLYDNDEWAVDRTKKMTGLTFAAQWPDFTDIHDQHNPPRLGDEKPGMYASKYTVYFKGKDSNYQIDVTEDMWRTFAVGKSYTLTLGIFGNIKDVR